MTSVISDSLVKPDMVAVLSRTHVVKELHGFLLPIFEAISNSMDGIESKFADKANLLGNVTVKFSHLNDPRNFFVEVTDNGIGLNDINYKHFKTPFSGHKLDIKGRGFGRFIGFKVFEYIDYCSHFEKNGKINNRVFRFDISKDNEFIFNTQDGLLKDTGLRVRYSYPLEAWHELIEHASRQDILEEIGSHFLPYFLYRWLPKITLQFDDDSPENITSHFKSVFVQHETDEFECEIEGVAEKLKYSLTRIPNTRQFKNHCLLLSAADRIVGYPRDLTNKIGEPFFVDEHDVRYIVLAVVRGEAFEKRLNDARTSIDLSPKAIETIVGRVSDAIQGSETFQIDKIKTDQSADLNGALQQNPILRLGLRGRTVEEYVRAKPNHWRAEQFISDLAIERYRASADLTKQITAAAKSPDDYEMKLKDLGRQVDDNKKEALAEYIIHRKNIISLVETARKLKDDGSHPPEDEIHELVFRRFSDSVQTSYFEHNLWLIDDTLSFLPYISSDRAMHGRGRKQGDKITDLIFFDDSMILGDEEGTTLTIVEFKKTKSR